MLKKKRDAMYIHVIILLTVVCSKYTSEKSIFDSQNCMYDLFEEDLLTLSEHISSSPVFSGVCVDRSLVFCVVFCRSLFVFLSFFLLVIGLSVLRFTAFDYSFGNFKLFICKFFLVILFYFIGFCCFRRI